MDKANSVIGAAIEYMEYLQDRVRTLEELQTTNPTTESTVVITDISTNEIKLPEIKARVCDNSILLKIQCLKRKGLLGKILGEVDKHDLTVLNISVTQFGTLALDITIITEMENKSKHSAKDMVPALRSALYSAVQAADVEEDEN